MLQKFKITSFAFTVSCAVFMTLPVNTSAQNDSNVQSRVVDLEGAVFILQNLNEEMSDTISELESKLSVIEYDVELATGKVEQTEEDLSTLVKWTGTGIMDGGGMAKIGKIFREEQKEERQEELEQLRSGFEKADEETNEEMGKGVLRVVELMVNAVKEDVSDAAAEQNDQVIGLIKESKREMLRSASNIATRIAVDARNGHREREH